MKFNRRTHRLGAAALGLTVLGAAAATLSANPASAAGVITALKTVSCSVTGNNWCIRGNDSSSGIGVLGTSESGTGLWGISTSQYGLRATSGSGEAIFAQTTSGDAAVTALGGSVNGNGVNASAGGVGISGTSTGTSSSSIGVLGYSSSGTGVFGFSTYGPGVYGSSTNYSGGSFQSSFGDGISATTAADGVIPAVEANAPNGLGGDFYGGNVGIISESPAAGYPLQLQSPSDIVFQVDGNGNVTYRGTLQAIANTVGGGTARSFSPDSTQPTVEDTGTAQLVRGAGVVRLDPTFAASIEPATGYRVFVTPDGDTRGLFVASKTAAGFVVRESQAGRSTVAFDYRIVATKLGAAGQHMAMVSPAEAHTLGSHVRLPAVPAVKLPARLPAAAVDPAKR